MGNRPAVWLCGILTTHVVLLMFTAARTAPTTDEPSHLAAGLYLWRSGQCHFYAVNPPLVKAVAAWPVFVIGANEDWSQIAPPPTRKEMNVGVDFAEANGADIVWMTTLARWACVPFCVLGGAVCYLWSNRLFGPPCGWISLTLWCFSPTILGNGAVISADVASAAAGVLAGYVFWQWLEKPTWERALLNGSALGLCWLVKLTWVILPGVWILVWLLRRLGRDQQPGSLGRELCQMVVSIAVGVGLLNVGYGFEGTLTRLGDFAFTSGVLSGKPPHRDFPLPGNRFQRTLLGSVPIPLPSSFVYGLDAQKQDFEETRVLYFAGQRSLTGWWYFYLLAVLLKEPPGTLLLGVLAALHCLRHPGWRTSVLRLGAVWIPPLIVMALVSSHPRLNYYRYLLPALPFAFVWVSQVGRSLAGSTISKGMVIVGLASSVVSSVASVPHSLSYVNVFGGGMRDGHRWFADCNYDWGEDLLALRRWMQQHPEARPLRVGYFGTVHPHFAGIEFEDLPRELLNPALRDESYKIPAGWYAISASHVHGIEGVVHPADKAGVRTVFDGGLTLFESEVSVARAGPSILIYRIE